MRRHLLAVGAGALALVMLAGCGPGVDLSKALQVTDVLGGYYDAGMKDGGNYLVPSITFRLHNTSDRTIGSTQLTVAFWQDGADTDWDSVILQGIGSDGLAAGASTGEIVARCPHGYTLDEARDKLFTHSLFQDVTVKFFASRAGTIWPLGEHKLDRVILPHVASDRAPQ